MFDKLRQKLREWDEKQKAKLEANKQRAQTRRRTSIPTTEVLFCSRCDEDEEFIKVRNGLKCSKCGYIVADPEQAQDEQDNQYEEEDEFPFV